MKTLIRLSSIALLGVAAAVLVSCGSSGTGLIPSVNAGPLQSDFEAVAQAAGAGNGDCAATESALGKTEQDFLALPATIDRGLHARLGQGISNLRKRALEMCVEPGSASTTATSAPTTTTPTTPTTTPTETTPTTTPSTTTTTPPTQSTPTTATPANPGGGTEAPEEGVGAARENGATRESGGARENDSGAGNGISGAGGASPGAGQ